MAEFQAHGYVHRDIKPSNILWRTGITGVPPVAVPVLSDLGLVKDVSKSYAERQTSDVTIGGVGTPGLCDWLKTEAKFNRRSVNQQILICLEWCMKTYGDAQFRNPFGTSSAGNDGHRGLHGAELARKLAALDAVSPWDAASMKRDASRLRKSKDRKKCNLALSVQLKNTRAFLHGSRSGISKR